MYNHPSTLPPQLPNHNQRISPFVIHKHNTKLAHPSQRRQDQVLQPHEDVRDVCRRRAPGRRYGAEEDGAYVGTGESGEEGVGEA
jgi:hypothetical protein